MTAYALKPRFQRLLRPSTGALARAGITANQLTVAAAAGSIAIGTITAWGAERRAVFLILPPWLLIRMALNAIDGMLAREHGQQSRLGGYLNELGDVAADAALYAPFALVSPFGAGAVGLVVVLAMVTELAGTLGPMMGGSRRYDGPLGKSDRAVVFGVLALLIGAAPQPPAWIVWVMPAIAGLLIVTVLNRVRAGIREAEQKGRVVPC